MKNKWKKNNEVKRKLSFNITFIYTFLEMTYSCNCEIANLRDEGESIKH